MEPTRFAIVVRRLSRPAYCLKQIERTNCGLEERTDCNAILCSGSGSDIDSDSVFFSFLFFSFPAYFCDHFTPRLTIRPRIFFPPFTTLLRFCPPFDFDLAVFSLPSPHLMLISSRASLEPDNHNRRLRNRIVFPNPKPSFGLARNRNTRTFSVFTCFAPSPFFFFLTFPVPCSSTPHPSTQLSKSWDRLYSFSAFPGNTASGP